MKLEVGGCLHLCNNRLRLLSRLSSVSSSDNSCDSLSIPPSLRIDHHSNSQTHHAAKTTAIAPTAAQTPFAPLTTLVAAFALPEGVPVPVLVVVVPVLVTVVVPVPVPGLVVPGTGGVITVGTTVSVGLVVGGVVGVSVSLDVGGGVIESGGGSGLEVLGPLPGGSSGEAVALAALSLPLLVIVNSGDVFPEFPMT